MNKSTIVCPHCKQPFEINDAIQHQIADELVRAKSEQSDTLRKEFDVLARRQVEQALQEAQQNSELQLEKERKAARFEMEKLRQSIQQEAEQERERKELEAEKLRRQAEGLKKNEQQLREEQRVLVEQLSAANKAREEADLAARKRMLEMEAVIRQEAAQRASEDFNTKIREQEETINKLREQLTTAKQVAEQGSQQLQGEILEMDVEQGLRSGFPYDVVDEVKKGERGSDIRQVVNEPYQQNCGLILWECKNAKTFQQPWVGKLKDEMAAEKAQVGVIVFQSPDGGRDFEQLADNVWLVRPRYVLMLATLLREVLVKVAIANRNAQGKDVKTEMMYTYLTGGEFSNRIRSIIESYDEMAKQLDTEKKQTQRRWAAQEKILQKVTGSLYGMSGDLQGIAGKEIIALPVLDEGEDGGGADRA